MNQKGNTFIYLLAAALVFIGLGIFIKTQIISPKTANYQTTTTNAPLLPSPNPSAFQEIPLDLKTHISNDLKISFKYLSKWLVNEKNRDILVTSYVTNIGEGKLPDDNQIRITIDQASLCQKTLDEEVLKGGCGEGVNSENKILSKDIKELQSGTFSTYKIKYPSGQETTVYYLQKAERVLQITKNPDPSKLEKEFNDLINSIEFK